jgi:precorrin-6B methylase 2
MTRLPDPIDELISRRKRAKRAPSSMTDSRSDDLPPLEDFQRAIGPMLFGTAAAQARAARDPRVQAVWAYFERLGRRDQGKDVAWLPTPPALIDKMLDMAGVTADDYVIDLGSGDGRIVIRAAMRGARALGIEYNAELVELSKSSAVKEGVADKAAFVRADFFESDFSQATVITMFLLAQINLKLRPKILDLKPGTRIVSNSFTMEKWPADEMATVEEGCTSTCTALFWTVPAKVSGVWQLPQGQLDLQQNFQMISGTFQSGGKTTPIGNAKLRGDQISFCTGGTNYIGRVIGNVMEGTSTGTSGGSWRAIRTAR